jgi:hypothetical protein
MVDFFDLATNEIAGKLNLKANTIQKAIQAGRLRKKNSNYSGTKGQRHKGAKAQRHKVFFLCACLFPFFCAFCACLFHFPLCLCA